MRTNRLSRYSPWCWRASRTPGQGLAERETGRRHERGHLRTNACWHAGGDGGGHLGPPRADNMTADAAVIREGEECWGD